ncbi:SDR family oxidoreductase [Aliikangiella sp. G2MR2-5]|uniref:SDR family oxidoreductase n=1 Tax=Aliikangiella sp. G2MR2-5 TaxID=2788943 RepID=UPI0018A96D88|nr:SDR family oxidoreductase [Aliikangiella sp. G2MR2-5]
MVYLTDGKPDDPMSIPTVIVTGAAKRLGRTIAEQFFTRGCNLVLHYNHSAQEAKALANKFIMQRENSCAVVGCDLEQDNVAQQIIDIALEKFGHIDYLINNASVFYPTPVEKASNDMMKSILKINWRQPEKLALAARPYLAEQQGAIVNLIDIYAEAGLSEHTFYVAAKAALLESSRMMARAFAPRVRVNCVSPGAILWPEQKEDNPSDKNEPVDKIKQKILDNSALKRLGSPADIASTATFLAMDASYMTGCNIRVDGGRRLYL